MQHNILFTRPQPGQSRKMVWKLRTNSIRCI